MRAVKARLASIFSPWLLSARRAAKATGRRRRKSGVPAIYLLTPGSSRILRFLGTNAAKMTDGCVIDPRNP